ncbi:hypothetical protein BDEG_27600 [Batrachochytrium dendrobatidis JEL423]|uniref:Uncharacterized protein n=1 Tax=Batrachochytrium dendrobatidis (strain JEL423) TaxID=403673 RepID=A0A177WWT1_BATDL|nr:hypothetical protein BDEG_27600 [Batrachochytrium dendrobatidis JEL423]
MDTSDFFEDDLVQMPDTSISIVAHQASPRLELNPKKPLQLPKTIQDQLAEDCIDWGSDDEEYNDTIEAHSLETPVPRTILSTRHDLDDGEAFWDEPDKPLATIQLTNSMDTHSGERVGSNVEEKVFDLQDSNCNWDELELDLMEFSLGDQQDSDWKDAMAIPHKSITASSSSVSLDVLIKEGTGHNQLDSPNVLSIDTSINVLSKQPRSSTPSGMHSPALSAVSSRRYMHSPAPSSNASVVASESDDEGFDDIDFTSQTQNLVLRNLSSNDTTDSIDLSCNDCHSFPKNRTERLSAPLDRLKKYAENNLGISFSDDPLCQDNDLDLDFPNTTNDESLADRLKSRLDSKFTTHSNVSTNAKSTLHHDSVTPKTPSKKPVSQHSKSKSHQQSGDRTPHQTVPISPLSMASVDTSYSQFGSITRIQNYSHQIKSQGRSVSTSTPTRTTSTASVSRLQTASSLAIRRTPAVVQSHPISKPTPKASLNTASSVAKTAITPKSSATKSTRLPCSRLATTTQQNVGKPPVSSFGAASTSNLLRKPRTKGHEGNGTELDHIEDLPVESTPRMSISTSISSIATMTTETSRLRKSNASSNSSNAIRPAWSNSNVNLSHHQSTMHNQTAYKFSQRPPTARIAFGRTMGSCDERDMSRSSSGMLGMGGVPNYRATAKQATKPPSKKKEIKKPTLIRNMGVADTVKVGDMVYNPILQVWEGNEAMLSDFEKAVVTPHRPALIQNIAASNLKAESIGGMVFDPDKMCWIGNEEEADVFAEIEMDIPDCSDSVCTKSTAFSLSKATSEGLYISEAFHKLFMGVWYPRVVQDRRLVMRDMSKAHLYEIRTILEHQ